MATSDLPFGPSEEVRMTFNLTGVKPEVFDLFYGGPLPAPREPEFSLMFDHQCEVSGEPCRPRPRSGWRGWLDWLTRRHAREWADYFRDRDVWVQAGRPTKTQTVRTYIPRATFKESQ